MFQRICMYLYFMLSSFLIMQGQVVHSGSFSQAELEYNYQYHQSELQQILSGQYDGYQYSDFQIIIEEEVILQVKATNTELQDYDVRGHYGVSRKRTLLTLSVNPYRVNHLGEVIGLVKFKIIGKQPRPVQNFKSRGRTYVENSVLKDGSFYKFSIPESAVYKLTFELLNAAGIEHLESAFSTLAIYGNSGLRLEENSTLDTVDDLLQIPTSSIDENNNGLFESGDAIVFYAPGPEDWRFEDDYNTYRYIENYYSNDNYIFVTNEGNFKSIPVETNDGTFSQTVNEFDHLQFIGQENISLIKSGRNWWNSKNIQWRSIHL